MLAHARPARRSGGLHASLRPRPGGRPGASRRPRRAGHLSLSVRTRSPRRGLYGAGDLLPAVLAPRNRPTAAPAATRARAPAGHGALPAVVGAGGPDPLPVAAAPGARPVAAPAEPPARLHDALAAARGGDSDRSRARAPAGRDGRRAGPLRARRRAPGGGLRGSASEAAGDPARRLRLPDASGRRGPAPRGAAGDRGAGDPQFRPGTPVQGDGRA